MPATMPADGAPTSPKRRWGMASSQKGSGPGWLNPSRDQAPTSGVWAPPTSAMRSSMRALSAAGSQGRTTMTTAMATKGMAKVVAPARRTIRCHGGGPPAGVGGAAGASGSGASGAIVVVVIPVALPCRLKA